jgi:hypothetical protein
MKQEDLQQFADTLNALQIAHLNAEQLPHDRVSMATPDGLALLMYWKQRYIDLVGELVEQYSRLPLEV